MELFEAVFNANGIYDLMFFNIKAVLEYPNLKDLETNNPALYKRWKYLSKSKYGFDMDVIHGVAGTLTDETPQYAQKTYEEKAVFYPEFTRIVAITYATLYPEKGETKRYFQKIVSEDEFFVINNFIEVLLQLSRNGAKSSPPYFPTFCGHNIINYDIPLLIKRFLKHIDEFKKILKPEETLKFPFILKRCLVAKPWESKVIDTVNVWKFNGNDYTPLMLIADFLGLKKTVDLDALPDVSKYYWNNVSEKPKEALEYVSLQSATQTNFVIQLMLKLREL